MTAEQFQAGVDKQQEALRRKGRLEELANEVRYLKRRIGYWRERAVLANIEANRLAEQLRKTELEMLQISEGLEP